FLLVPIATLSASTLYSCYAYRGLVRSLGQLDELRLVNELVRRVNEVRLTACDLSRVHYDRSLLPLTDDEPPPDVFELRHQLGQVRDVLGRYQEQLGMNDDTELRIRGGEPELAQVRAIEATLGRLDRACLRLDVFENARAGALRSETEKLQAKVGELPGRVRRNVLDCTEEVHGVYRMSLALTLASLALTVATMVLL